MKPFRLTLVALAASLVLSGCAMQQIHHQVERGNQAATAAVKPVLAAVDNAPTTAHHGPIITDLPYVSPRAVKHVVHPAILDQQVRLTVASPRRLAAVLASITRLSGVPISAAPEVLNGTRLAASSAPAPSSGNDSTLSLPPPSVIQGSAGSFATRLQPMSYHGSLSGLLDRITAALHATWHYDPASGIHVYRYQTRVFTLATLPGSSTSSGSVGAGGSQQNVHGGRGQEFRISSASTKSGYKADLKVWQSVGKTVATMLSPAGSMVLSPATGTLTVRDLYSRVDQVADYIEQINHRLSLAVLVNVKVYHIQTDNKDAHGFDWSVLYNAMGQAANKIGATIVSPSNAISGAADATITPPKDSRVAGSQFFLKALSTLGDTTEVQNVSLDTTNNVPATFKNVKSTAYLAESADIFTNGSHGATNGNVVGAGATLKPGNVETGYTLQILPSVQADGHHLLLRLTMSDSTLGAMNTVTSGGSSIQTPDVSNRETSQAVWLKSGQSLVLAGYDQHSNKNTTHTPLGKFTWFVGGDRQMEHKRSAIVIVVTPVVTDAASSL